MKINIKGFGFTKELEVEANQKVYEILGQLKEDMKYPVYACRIRNHYASLDAEIGTDDVELLDITNNFAWRSLQNSLELLFLKAVYDVMGKETEVLSRGSFNKGIYLSVHRMVSETLLNQVKERMDQLIKENHPVESDGNTHKLLDLSVSLWGAAVPFTAMVSEYALVPYKNGFLLRYPHSLDPLVVPEYVDQPDLANMFIESANWNRVVGCQSIEDLNQKVREGKMRQLVLMQESYNQNRIADIAKDIVKKNKRIVLICGPSSSGKTTFANRLCLEINTLGHKTSYMGTDDYYAERSEMPIGEDGERDYESIGALDVKLFQKNMKELLNGEEADLPVYDFTEMTKKFGRRKMRISEDTIMVIEGILTLDQSLTSEISDEYKYKIYISPVTAMRLDALNRISNTDLRMVRRMTRDFKFRNTKAERTIQLWPKVRAGEEKNIFPNIEQADAFYNSYNFYEETVIRKYCLPILKEIREDQPEYAEAQRLVAWLEMYEELDDESPILNNSILREFIGGSVIVD